MAKYSISVNKLYKSFGKIKVLKGISFQVEQGKILALLGPNGAGKTTTINIISTLMKADSGVSKIAGFDVLKNGDMVRASIGLTGQFAAVDEYLTGRENIKMIGLLYHLNPKTLDQRVEELLVKFDLIDAADRAAKNYSGGMKRRLDLAMSLVASPPIIILDEPTTGLDPRSRLGLWRMIKALADEGKTILLTTQHMEEAEFLSDNVIVLDQGKIIAKGTVKELKTQAGSEQVEVSLKKQSDISKVQKLFKNVVVNEDGNDIFTIPAKNGIKSLAQTILVLQEAKIAVDTAALRRPTLDEVFIALTGHSASEKKVDNKKKKDK